MIVEVPSLYTARVMFGLLTINLWLTQEPGHDVRGAEDRRGDRPAARGGQQAGHLDQLRATRQEK